MHGSFIIFHSFGCICFLLKITFKTFRNSKGLKKESPCDVGINSDGNDGTADSNDETNDQQNQVNV